MPKVITGIRRCGKSTLLKQIYLPYLKEDGLTDDHILIMDLDDDSNLQYRNPVELGRFARAFCGGKDHCVVILDEIQMVDTILNPVYTEGRYILADKNDTNIVSFVDVILGLSRQPNIDLYVTGSNSKMLSADIVTQFRDKAENIRIGRPSATDAEVEQAARQSGCHDFILGLEKGYDTLVGSSGGHLSGGERQRISIARAMLKAAPIVILDEATAYTDPENEAVIQRSVSKLTEGKTLIVIAHRLSTVMDADKIYVIKDGQIDDAGSHEELLRHHGLYEKMWNAHMEVKDNG